MLLFLAHRDIVYFISLVTCHGNHQHSYQRLTYVRPRKRLNARVLTRFGVGHFAHVM